jgi:carbon monoxide dehydrogenase subunit G
MKLQGHYDLPVPRDRVWQALLDPEQLAKAIPGCEKLDAVGPGEYRATLKVGVGAVKGTFDGKVKISDIQPPTRYTMMVEGSGGPGFVRGEAVMELSEAEGGTRVEYEGDVQIGGLIAGVGQRMLGGVAKMMVDQFFSRMAELLGGAQ